MPITPNWPLGNGGCMGRWGTLNIENHVWGPWCVISGGIILSWYMLHVWYSQPASEEHPIDPNQPQRNGCMWQHYGACETHQTLKTTSMGPDVSFGDKYLSLDACIMYDTPNWPVRNATLFPTGHWGMAAFDSTMGHVKHIIHWKSSWVG